MKKIISLLNLILFADLCSGQTANEWYAKGISAYREKRYEEAILFLTKSIENNYTPLANAYNARGVVKKNSGKFLSAIADYDNAILLDSNFVDAYNNRGIAKKI
jgi:tetratricopeptide (TPR) repeat protein